MNSLPELAAMLFIGVLIGSALSQTLSRGNKSTFVYVPVPAPLEQESNSRRGCTGVLTMLALGLVLAGLFAVVAFG